MMMTWMRWIARQVLTVTQGDRAVQQAPAAPTEQLEPPRIACTAEYLPLQKYLVERYADTVVLRLTEIEDLLGFPLPALARLQPAWWADAITDSSPSAQSCSWTQASRSARPNLLASTV